MKKSEKMSRRLERALETQGRLCQKYYGNLPMTYKEQRDWYNYQRLINDSFPPMPRDHRMEKALREVQKFIASHKKD